LRRRALDLLGSTRDRAQRPRWVRPWRHYRRVGVAHRPAELDLRFIQLHGIAIKGCFGGDTQGDRDVATYVDWFDDAAVGLRALVTHSYGLGDALRAVADVREGKITGRGIFAIAAKCAANPS
jgi:Zn-dependent alcohol dehydrogenase